jgi:predicted dehydrogenase
MPLQDSDAMSHASHSSRRGFLRSASTAAAAASLVSWLPGTSRGDDTKVAASDRLTLGVIGIGPRCTYDLTSILKFPDVQCVAIADVQASRRDKGKVLVDTAYGNSDCQLHNDFRDLLARDDIDAVLIATGDRWHGPASILAAEAGKDVYSEKPCGISIDVCQQLEATFREKQRVFQAGTQRRSVANFAKAVELAHTGKLGNLTTLYASIYRPTLDNTWLPGEPTPPKEVVDWNLWLGPAAWRPFNQQYVNGGWRGQWDFDSGAKLLDWGAHTLDLCQWANQSDDTMPIEYIPLADKIECKYENGVKLVLDFLAEPFGNRDPHYITRLGTCPVRFEGDEGSVETGDEGEIVCSSEALQKELGETYQRVRGLDVAEHARDFFDCIRSRGKTHANAEVMRRSHIACHAASIAWILNRPIRINPKTEEFIDDPEANMLRARPARHWQT